MKAYGWLVLSALIIAAVSFFTITEIACVKKAPVGVNGVGGACVPTGFSGVDCKAYPNDCTPTANPIRCLIDRKYYCAANETTCIAGNSAGAGKVEASVDCIDQTNGHLQAQIPSAQCASNYVCSSASSADTATFNCSSINNGPPAKTCGISGNAFQQACVGADGSTTCVAWGTCSGGGGTPTTCTAQQTKCGTSCCDNASQYCDPSTNVCQTFGSTGSCSIDANCPAAQTCQLDTAGANGKCRIINGACGTGLTSCQTVTSSQPYCALTSTDPNNCGTCNHRCGAYTCNGGQCSNGCAAPATNCNGSCADTQTDPNNCGSCGNKCPNGQRCQAGTCGCTAPYQTCGNACVNVASDNVNCGGCGITCTNTQNCSSSHCCSIGQIYCNGSCIDASADANNCGSCGNKCPSGTCANSVCSNTCPTVAGQNQQLCNGKCTDVTSDSNNCGACGQACSATQTCVDSLCEGGL